MNIQHNISLKPFNSFGIDLPAKYFATFSSINELNELVQHFSNERLLLLGGGSNILFTKPFDGAVIKNNLKGIELVNEDADHFYVRAQAGENWHEFVQYCIAHKYAGIENLSLIPGNVGASPMQNIGAYGVEIKDIFYELEAYHLKDHTLSTFRLQDCAFGYRESVFKKQFANQFAILNVTYRLNKRPVYNTSYGAIEQELAKLEVKDISIKAISDAVISIRSSKLPDPKTIGNAGSFFKNPVIPLSLYEQLKKDFDSIPGYPVQDGFIKTAAGWLIEQCGWKGYRHGDSGCYPKQALVLVNYGNANGQEIFDLSELIIQSVAEKFGIKLEREVNIF